MRKKFIPLLLMAVALLVCAVTITACGSDESREDANDVSNGHVEKSSPASIAFNNHYPNVETKCDGFGHRIYVTTHDSSTGQNILVIPDASCQGPGTGYDEIIATNEQPPSRPPSTNPADYPPIAVGGD